MNNLEKLKQLVSMVGKDPYEGLDTQGKKLAKLEQILRTLDESITKEEFIKSFETVIKQILEIEKKLIQKIDAKTSSAFSSLEEIQKTHKEVISRIEKENSSSFSNMKKWAMEQVGILFVKYQIKEKIDLLDEKMGQIRDGKDGLLGKDGKDGSPDNPEQVRDKLETLKDGEKLSIQAIQDLSKMLEEIKQTRIVRGGGGFSKIAMDSHFIDDETPSGTVNGVNTDFVLADTPWPTSSLKVYRSGARQRITEDYTLSGKTITFLTAPVVGEIILCDYRC